MHKLWSVVASVIAAVALCAWSEVSPEVSPGAATMPSLEAATGWLNSGALTSGQLRGKVVLVDFWTYSCINCLRTLPYVRAWAQKYREAGLVVIGVHTPEFGFEQQGVNVQQAVKDLHIDYPVALDSRQGLWRAFGNRAWPALYFVDAQGRIRHRQYGEGGYAQAERLIQQLLTEADRGAAVPTGLVNPTGEGTQAAAGPAPADSQETYVGSARASGFVAAADGQAAPNLRLNEWTLMGRWRVEDEFASLTQAGGRIAYRFRARDLHLVLAADPGRPVRFRVRIDGHAPGRDHGADTDAEGQGSVSTQRLYQLVRQASDGAERTFDIEFLDPGVRAYAFTFG